jgi:glycosyltransferase A (GT-A) superfamily protein (DUF2064 family)
LKQPQPELILPVEMSTPHVLEETIGLAKTAGIQTSLLPIWYDVDSTKDLIRLRSDLIQSLQEIAPHTKQYLMDEQLNFSEI